MKFWQWLNIVMLLFCIFVATVNIATGSPFWIVIMWFAVAAEYVFFFWEEWRSAKRLADKILCRPDCSDGDH